MRSCCAKFATSECIANLRINDVVSSLAGKAGEATKCETKIIVERGRGQRLIMPRWTECFAANFSTRVNGEIFLIATSFSSGLGAVAFTGVVDFIFYFLQ